MLRVGYEGRAHTEDKLRIYLNVSVNQNSVVLCLLPLERIGFALVVVQGTRELLEDCLAIGEMYLSPQFSFGYLLITEVHPLHLSRIDWPAVLGRYLREIEWPRSDEKILLLFSIDPLYNARRNQVGECKLAGSQAFQV